MHLANRDALGHAELWLPELALAGCVRAVVVRDTRRAHTADRATTTYLPATPLAGLICWLYGTSEAVDAPGFALGGECYEAGRLDLAGPMGQPSCMRSVGPVYVLHILMPPDALHRLAGVDVAALANRVVPAQAWLPRDWLAWMRSVASAPDDRTRMQLVADFLRPRWQADTPRGFSGGRYRDWAEALALRAATSRGGRSLRQIERRIKRWAGLPMREIEAMARGEATFLAAASPPAGEIGWADLAAEQGYADQPHLCRTSKRLTGFSPAELARRLPDDEALWAYRLWL